jgi:hypothetical protein
MTSEFRAWATVFLAEARQLDQPALGVQWFKMGVSASDAAAWANLGFYPDEAAPLIADGTTPQMQREIEDHAEAQASGPDALAAQRVAHMIETGLLVREDQVIRIPDPTDPDVEIIVVRDDLGGRP